MKTFSYGQYIKCIHTLRLNAVLQLAEEGVEYHCNQTERKSICDRVMKNVLENKKEVAQFMNQFLEPREEIEEEDLMRCNNHYRFKRDSVVYKLKKQDTFFLIEHYSTVDNSMPYRILNQCLDIMQEWSKNKKRRKNIGYPIIVPIVIYTGKQKWKVSSNCRENKVSYYVFERNKIDIEYNFIDINKIPRQKLLETKTMFGYIMCMEKLKTKQELTQNPDLMNRYKKG